MNQIKAGAIVSDALARAAAASKEPRASGVRNEGPNLPSWRSDLDRSARPTSDQALERDL